MILALETVRTLSSHWRAHWHCELCWPVNSLRSEMQSETICTSFFYLVRVNMEHLALNDHPLSFLTSEFNSFSDYPESEYFSIFLAWTGQCLSFFFFLLYDYIDYYKCKEIQLIVLRWCCLKTPCRAPLSLVLVTGLLNMLAFFM